eukprot:scaffold31474_cov33-Tisochrysis_lutea.AAC.3
MASEFSCFLLRFWATYLLSQDFPASTPTSSLTSLPPPPPLSRFIPAYFRFPGSGPTYAGTGT